MSDEDLKILAQGLLDFIKMLEYSSVKLREQIEKLFGPAQAQVKICRKCGRPQPTTSRGPKCLFCGGTLITKCVPKQKE